MTAVISFGKPDTTWKSYGLAEYPVRFNNQPSKFKAITREGKLVTIIGAGYQLLPNEEVQKAAATAAKLLDLTPYKSFYNPEGTRLHDIYIAGERMKVNGETVQVGCDVRNAIDGTSGFGCSTFTFREMCSNGVIFGYKEIAGVTHMHTKGLQPIIDNLKNIMILTLEKAQDLVAFYQELAARQASIQLAEKLKKSRLPLKVLPDYLKAEEVTATELEARNQWELYNDITELIWHNEAKMKTKTHQFQVLHQVLRR